MTYKRWFIAALLLPLTLSVGGLALADNDPPTDEQVAFAKDVYGLMFNEVVAALFTEFNETTPGNVEHGKLSISLIFNNSNRDMRLVGAFGPLLGGSNDLPSDAFEAKALALALKGKGLDATERINGRWYYRRSFPLSNTLHTACATCHTNFTPAFFQQTNNPDQWVGTLVQRVPIQTGH